MRGLLVIVATVVVAAAAALALLLFVAGRDKSGVDSGGGASGGPGTRLPDDGDRILAPGDPDPHYSTSPPASGAHHARPVTRDAATLTDDQLLTALAAGNVVLLYGGGPPPPALRAVPREAQAPFSAHLARAGQSVILARRPGTRGVTALAWRRRLTAASPADPRLGEFADHWLGAGAG